MLISFTVTAKLICAFVFAYAERLFSHDVAQFFEAVIVQIALQVNISTKVQASPGKILGFLVSTVARLEAGKTVGSH